MCFSISMVKTAEEIAASFGVFSGNIPPLPEYYHVSGFTFPEVPVLFDSEGEKQIKLMKWGLIPSWIKTEKDADNIRSKTLNARSETADSLPSFRGPFKTGRCIIITDGFYEPHHREGKSYPYYIRRKDSGVIPLGGLFDVFSSNGYELFTFSILTIPASPMLAEIHNKKKRMPFIIPSGTDDSLKNINKWLDPEAPHDLLKEMFEKTESDETDSLEAYSVSKDIYKKGTIDKPSNQKRFEYKELTEGFLSF